MQSLASCLFAMELKSDRELSLIFLVKCSRRLTHRIMVGVLKQM
jgi:hypothetical protein